MKVIALIFVLSSFISLHHGFRLTPAWLDSIPELPQGPEEVLSLETLERNDAIMIMTMRWAMLGTGGTDSIEAK